MIRTEVGYAGGQTRNPTYHNIADHAEAVDVWFDPTKRSYQQLLDSFWASHDPTMAGRGQYRAALFCHDDTQRALAVASRNAEANKYSRAIQTKIVSAPFYPAEAYHQKWRLRRCEALWTELRDLYPNEAALLRSATAAKINGFVGGRTDHGDIERYIDRLGLSEKGKRVLRNGGG